MRIIAKEFTHRGSFIRSTDPITQPLRQMAALNTYAIPSSVEIPHGLQLKVADAWRGRTRLRQ